MATTVKKRVAKKATKNTNKSEFIKAYHALGVNPNQSYPVKWCKIGKGKTNSGKVIAVENRRVHTLGELFSIFRPRKTETWTIPAAIAEALSKKG